MNPETAKALVLNGDEGRGRGGSRFLSLPGVASSPPRRFERSLSAEAMSPHTLTHTLAAALSAADLDRATSLFAADGCFVTPDATAVHGLQGIRALLAQLSAGAAQLRIEPQSMYAAGSMALCNERWTFTYAREDTAPFVQVSDSTVLLRRCDRVWKLLIAAPWGIADADRHPFASLPWPRQRRRTGAAEAATSETVLSR